jgi:predicted Zn-dependent peptidase
VAYCGISIDAGTRDEQKTEFGMAHFCEHMLFKGTKKRKAWHILNRMESVGGDLNAYTNKEETVVYSAFVKEHFSRAAELICDVVLNSTYPQHEMDKEAEVIIDEIESYNDSPAELIFDRFENAIFSNHPLGHDILGDAESIRRYNSDDAKHFTQRMYRPEKMVFFVFGDVDFKHIVKTVEKCFVFPSEVSENPESSEPSDKFESSATPESPKCSHIVEHRSTHQAHVMMGCKGYPSKDERRIALYFLNNIIGGPGMNSRLNVALREHHGLVYTVESTLTNYTDTATFAIYFGCDPEDVKKCIRLVRKELDKLIDKPLTEKQMKAYIKQMSGQIRVACDNRENYALDMAKGYLHYGKFEGIDETIRHLNSLTPEFVQQVAAETFREDNITIVEFLP